MRRLGLPALALIALATPSRADDFDVLPRGEQEPRRPSG